jgi:hypothetical protein
VLAGQFDVGLETLRDGALRFPGHATLLSSLRKVEMIGMLQRLSFGLVPTDWLTAVARRASR